MSVFDDHTMIQTEESFDDVYISDITKRHISVGREPALIDNEIFHFLIQVYRFYHLEGIGCIQVHEGITFVNPGSAMINRGSYGYGTYAIIDTEPFNVIFYDNQDHHICNQEVLDEGMQLLKEFKKLVKNIK